MTYQAKNNVYSTLAGSLTDVATSLTVQTGHGDRFPVISAPNYTMVTLEDASGNREVIKVTARAGAADSMTIVRAQEGTTARAWAAGDSIELRMTAGEVQTLFNHVDDTTDAHDASAISSIPSGNLAATDVQSALNELQGDIDELNSSVNGYFYKADTQSVAFTKTAAGTVSVKAGTEIAVASTLQTFATDTAVVMPALTGGTDYAIYACTDGTVRADASFTAPSGYTVNNSRHIGGFHYAPGGNAAAQAGGNTTPAINEYSIWDLKFRPACSDPRGMALIAGNFWADIYLLGVDYLTNGSSKYNVSIADGSAPPKRSTLYGGNGTTTYADGNWWNMNEALKHCGKRSPTYSEFAALAYGTTEATSSGGTDVPTTGATGTGATSAWNLFTSKFGIIQASGCLWIWGDEFGGGAAAAGYVANTQGRGSTYQMENAVLLGGTWDGAAASGSRASAWHTSAPASYANLGARGVCDHLTLV